jgi:hypothetical protein
MSAYLDVLDRPMPDAIPTHCWECEAISREMFEAPVLARTERRSSIMLCRSCFQSCYLPLAEELVTILDKAPVP